VNTTARHLNASEAAQQLGITAKALRLYEERGLLHPARTAAGWRAYDPSQMARAAEIVELRALGLSLAEVASVLDGDGRVLERVLAAHELALEARARALHAAADKVRLLRTDLALGNQPDVSQIARALQPTGSNVSFDLPWPWGGERFELRDIGRLNFIVGPLGSGKTRLAMKLAEKMSSGRFVGLDRLMDGGAAARGLCAADAALNARVEEAQTSIVEGGGSSSDALLTLLTVLETGISTNLVIDVPEQGLDGPTQEALMGHLRRRPPDAGALFLLTRSDAILDLENVSADETIILCPANHSPPMLVAPHRGTPGYEALATCLAPPHVRARTEGVVAWRPSLSLVKSVEAARHAASKI
jgi:DNA-binding transcriptional MerR regulator